MNISKVADSILKDARIVIDRKEEDENKLVLTIDKLAKGSSRIVYPFFDFAVLKFGFSPRGIAQNHTEAMLYNADDAKEARPYLGKIIQYAEDYKWTIMERCRLAREDDFTRLFGLPFANFVEVLNWWKRGEEKPEEYSDYEKMVWFEPLKNLIEKYKMHIPDIRKMNAWGVTKDDKLKLVDYGITREVWNTYYKKKKKGN